MDKRGSELKRIYGGALALVLAAAVLSASCGDNSMGGGMDGGMMDAAPSGAILVRLSNWSIDSAKSSVQSGEVTFRAVHDMHDMHNNGEGITHELVVARKNKDGTFDVVGEAESIGVGEHKDLTLKLDKGEYELQCNIVEQVNGKAVSHYKNGMRAKFMVT